MTDIEECASWVRSTYGRTAGGDVEYVLERFRDDVVIEDWSAPRSNQIAGVPWRQTERGRAGCLAYWRRLQEWTGGMKVTVRNVLAGGDQVAVVLAVQFEMPTIGPMSTEAVTIWTFDEQGMVVSVSHHTDTAAEIAAYERMSRK